MCVRERERERERECVCDSERECVRVLGLRLLLEFPVGNTNPSNLVNLDFSFGIILQI